jgi:hypothetical protein
MRLSIAVHKDGAFVEHVWHKPLCSSIEEEIEAVKTEVSKLTGEWIVIDLDAKSVYDQLDWWDKNPWSRSDTTNKSDRLAADSFPLNWDKAEDVG